MTEPIQQPQMQPIFPNQQPQEGRTPEEIMITLIAQVIIMNCASPKPQEKQLERPFEMGKKQELDKSLKNSEKLTFKETKETGKSETSKPNSPISKSSTESGHVRVQESKTPLSNHIATKIAVKKGTEQPHQIVRTAIAQPLSEGANTNQVKQMPVPPQETRVRNDASTTPKELGTSRRAMPQPPNQPNASCHTLFEKRVDRDKEEHQQKRSFQKGKTKKVAGNSKVAKIAQKHLLPPKNSDDHEKFLRSMMEDSELSQFLGRRVSHFDVILLFFELMKLQIEDNYIDKQARIENRRAQIEWMEKHVQACKSQASQLFFIGASAGALAAFGGIIPILGQISDSDFLQSAIGRVFSSYASLSRPKFYDKLSATCIAMSDMNRTMGQAESAFAEGERAWTEHKSGLFRSDADEGGRLIEERSREFKNWNDILAQILRMEQDLVRQLYS